MVRIRFMVISGYDLIINMCTAVDIQIRTPTGQISSTFRRRFGFHILLALLEILFVCALDSVAITTVLGLHNPFSNPYANRKRKVRLLLLHSKIFVFTNVCSLFLVLPFALIKPLAALSLRQKHCKCITNVTLLRSFVRHRPIGLKRAPW